MLLVILNGSWRAMEAFLLRRRQNLYVCEGKKKNDDDDGSWDKSVLDSLLAACLYVLNLTFFRTAFSPPWLEGGAIPRIKSSRIGIWVIPPHERGRITCRPFHTCRHFVVSAAITGTTDKIPILTAYITHTCRGHIIKPPAAVRRQACDDESLMERWTVILDHCGMPGVPYLGSLSWWLLILLGKPDCLYPEEESFSVYITRKTIFGILKLMLKMGMHLLLS